MRIRDLFAHQRLSLIAIALLLGLMVVFGILSMKDDSATSDEAIHVGAGYSYLTKQDYRLNPEHPPLVKDLAAFPLLFLDIRFPLETFAIPDSLISQWALGEELLYRSGSDADQILFWARLPMLLFLVSLGLFLFYWTNKIAGVKAGLFVLTLFAFSPNFLAHGRLVTNDVAATLGIVVSIYFYLKFLRNPSIRSGFITGGIVGVTLLLKFSTIILIPYFVLLAMLFFAFQPVASGEFRSLLRIALLSLWMGVVAFSIVGVVYSLHITNYPAERQIQDAQANLAYRAGTDPEQISLPFLENSLLRPHSQYFLGVALVYLRTHAQGTDYFLGETGPAHWWYYFPILYFFKVPLAFHVLSLIAFGSGLYFLQKSVRRKADKKAGEWLRLHFVEVSMVCFIILYVGIAMFSSVRIGIRHILPVFPFFYILVAIGIKKWMKDVRSPSFKTKQIIILGLVGWYIISSVSSFPSYLSYYNVLAGGSENGYKIAVNSNYDWGQDLKRLATWVDSQGIERIYVEYIGRENRAAYYLGEKYIPWRSSSLWTLLPVEKRDNGEDFPKGNYLAVSATFLVWNSENGEYAWLEDYEPVARIGQSIFVYYIE